MIPELTEKNIITAINSLHINDLNKFKVAIEKNFSWERNSKGKFISDYREWHPLYLKLLVFICENQKYVDSTYGFTANMNNGGRALWLVNNAINKKTENQKNK